MDDTSNNNPNYLQTVGRALEMLDLFSQETGISLSAAARALGISTTVAYRLLYTLSACGFLRQDDANKCYYLGDKAILLGYRAVQSLELRRVIHGILWEFYERTKYNVALTICCDGKSLCIEKLDVLLEPQPGVMFSGGVYPLHKGASNRTLLAFLPEDERERYIDSLPAGERGPLREILKRVVWQGYDMSHEELTPGLYSVGFPVFGADNRLAAAFSINGRLDDLNDARLEEMIRQGRQVTARMSSALGSARAL